MFGLTIYKILSFILLPIGALLGLVGLFGIISGLGNPYLLLSSAITICTCIYIFASFLFVYNSLINNKQSNSSLKDWIKVNAYVALFISSSCIIDFVTLKSKPSLINDFTKQMNTMTKSLPPEAMTMMPQIINSVLYFLLVFGLILFVHITFSLSLIKTKAHLFEEE